MALFKRGGIWWYEFLFARRRVRESAKTTSKTVAKLAEQSRRRELESGFNGIQDKREERVRSIKEISHLYLDDYRLRHKAIAYAEYAVGNVTRHLGQTMVVDVTEHTVTTYQTTRLKESAAPKTINEEVGFLLRLLGEAGDVIRIRLRRRKALKLAVPRGPGKAYTPYEKAAMLAAANAARSRAIYPALMLALNTGERDAEIRGLQWERVDLARAVLTVGDSKTEAGEGKAGVSGRWHDNRHTLITDLAESGAGDETIRDIAGHVSPRMLKHYSHIRMEAKRKALEAIVSKPPPNKTGDADPRPPETPIQAQAPPSSSDPPIVN